ncbi:hypothetical protein [Sphingobium aquiterrae]|uniref:hypothetical protein n=1 Tax=Sphingobium aquiterrae TaxID=2038656 RepID=UPI0030196DB2
MMAVLWIAAGVMPLALMLMVGGLLFAAGVLVAVDPASPRLCWAGWAFKLGFGLFCLSLVLIEVAAVASFIDISRGVA